ncbi:MAG TPA: F0F1 ATP synthase subunit delta [Methylococcaceae bacterium]|nr:F0F1 ATP synthase subunit delta [Methylococcaceae bacterium]
MNEIATLARPYAVAVFKRAKETNSSKQWSKKLSFLAMVLGDNKLAGMIDDPKVGKSNLLALLLDICADQLDQEGINFLTLLIENNKLSLIPAIAALFETYKAEDEGFIDIDVTTAYAFSKEAKQDFNAALEKSFGKKVNMKVAVDSSLIGGVLVRAGDQVIDGSVRGQLQQLAQRL